MKKHVLGLIISTALWSSHTHSATFCQENVTQVIQGDNGNVWFTTDKTCPNWCKLNWVVSDAVKRAYAALLTARVSGKPVTFYWQNLDSCGQINPIDTAPLHVIL